MFALVCFLGSGLGGFLVYAGVWFILVIVVCFYLGVSVIGGWVVLRLVVYLVDVVLV